MDCSIREIIFTQGDDKIVLTLTDNIKMSPLLDPFQHIQSEDKSLIIDVDLLSVHLHGEHIAYTLNDIQLVVDFLTLPHASLLKQPGAEKLWYFIEVYTEYLL